jgi:hypothetical protein
MKTGGILNKEVTDAAQYADAAAVSNMPQITMNAGSSLAH